MEDRRGEDTGAGGESDSVENLLMKVPRVPLGNGDHDRDGAASDGEYRGWLKRHEKPLRGWEWGP